jgi:hypothetical protein
MEKTDNAFRLVVKRWVVKQRELFETRDTPYAYHAVATNCSERDKTAAEVLAWHNQRGRRRILTRS